MLITSRLFNFDEIPIDALSATSRQVLSSGLNASKVILTDDGLPRDWRGLLAFFELKMVSVPQLVMHPDPMNAVLAHWVKEKKSLATIGQLFRCLSAIDRYDVLDDASEICRKSIMIEF